MHTFYDNAANTQKKEQNAHVSLQCSTSKKRTNNARFKEIHLSEPASLSDCACLYNKDVAVTENEKKKKKSD